MIYTIKVKFDCDPSEYQTKNVRHPSPAARHDTRTALPVRTSDLSLPRKTMVPEGAVVVPLNSPA